MSWGDHAVTSCILRRLRLGCAAVVVGSVACDRDATPRDDLGWVAPVIDSTVARARVPGISSSGPLSVDVGSFLEHLRRLEVDVDSARFVAAVGRPLLDRSTRGRPDVSGRQRGDAYECSKSLGCWVSGGGVHLNLEGLERTGSGFTARIGAAIGDRPQDSTARSPDIFPCSNLWEFQVERRGKQWVVGPARLEAMC